MIVLHATTVACFGRAVVITGPSGSGKSALALDLMALGAALVADDRTELQAHGPTLIASCPAAILGQIEARFVGILRADPAGPTPVALVVDLSQVETDRLPPPRITELDGVSLPVLHKVESGYFSAAILQYLRSGPIDERPALAR